MAPHRVVVDIDEIDSSNASDFASMLMAAPAGDVAVDMSRVLYIDSVGLQVLVNERRIRETHGEKVTVVNPSRIVARLFSIDGLAEDFGVTAPDDV